AAGLSSQSFNTREQVEESEIAEFVGVLNTGGYAGLGDGGGGLYARVPVEPTHAGKIQSADGAWWELATASSYPAQVFGFGIESDNHATLSAAVAFMMERGGTLRLPRGTFTLASDFVLADGSAAQPFQIVG